MKKHINSRLAKTALMLILILSLISTAAFADNEWAKNLGDWVKDGVWWLALAGTAVYALKLLSKRQFVQFGGFIVLAALVLVIIDDPAKLKTVGLYLYNKVINGS